jgi:hypothetical protein
MLKMWWYSFFRISSGATTLCIMTHSIMTLSKDGLSVTLSIKDTQQKQHSPIILNVECRILFYGMLYVFLLSATKLSVVMLSVIMLSVFVLSVIIMRFIMLNVSLC